MSFKCLCSQTQIHEFVPFVIFPNSVSNSSLSSQQDGRKCNLIVPDASFLQGLYSVSPRLSLEWDGTEGYTRHQPCVPHRFFLRGSHGSLSPKTPCWNWATTGKGSFFAAIKRLRESPHIHSLGWDHLPVTLP
jgi:hypothetical protein